MRDKENHGINALKTDKQSYYVINFSSNLLLKIVH